MYYLVSVALELSLNHNRSDVSSSYDVNDAFDVSYAPYERYSIEYWSWYGSVLFVAAQLP